MESMNDALIACVKALGGSKQVGPLLWPDAAPDAAQRKLLDCLNEDRPHHLTPAQTLMVLRLARHRGFHDAADFMMAELGYAAPVPVEPRDEAAELQRQFITASNQLAAMLGRIESLQAQAAGHKPNLRAAA